MKKDKKRIRIAKGEYISMRQVHKIGEDLKKKNLDVTRENILQQHYRLQTAHPLKRILFGAIGAFIIAGPVYFEFSWPWFLISLPAGSVLCALAWRGKKEEIDGMLKVSSGPENITAEAAKSLLEIVFEILIEITPE